MERRNLFEAEFRQLLDIALGMARRVLQDEEAAEDAAAEALARAYANWHRLADADHRHAWVARVAMNVAIDGHRRRSGLFTEPFPSSGGLEEAATARLVIRDALKRLPKRQREAVALCWLAGFSEADAAAVLGVSGGSIKQHLHRGTTALRARLAFEDKEPSHVL